jgi:hypothetical protein
VLITVPCARASLKPFRKLRVALASVASIALIFDCPGGLRSAEFAMRPCATPGRHLAIFTVE